MLSNYPGVRKTVYLVYVVIGLLLGAYASYQGALGHSTADWYVGGIAAFGYIGTGLGFVAGSNVSTHSGGPAPGSGLR
jgi:hypothetical protein